MLSHDLKSLAQQLTAHQITAAQFLETLAPTLFNQLSAATVDIDRQRRCGYAEVVFGQGKTIEAFVEVCQSIVHCGQPLLATRVSPEQAMALLAHQPTANHNPVARTIRYPCQDPASDTEPTVAVVSAGTGDQAVAEEALETLRWMNVPAILIQDVGVAGPQRLQAHLPVLRTMRAIIVVAGMEGALPSVVGGHVACPIVAVPTSVGYGTAFGGITALLGMLNSCAANVTVVNIDAGFKAGYVCGMIANR